MWRSGDISNNERCARASSPPRGHLRLVKPKKEPRTGGKGSSLHKPKTEPEWSASRDYVRSSIKLEASNDDEEFPCQKMSYDILQADIVFARAWSKAEHECKEVERQRRPLEEA